MNEQIELTVQVKELRRQNLTTRWIGGLLIAFLSAIVIFAQIRHPETVEATQFLLKDGKGNIVAKLGQVGFGGTCLTLNAGTHAADAELCVNDDDSSSLILLNHHGDSRVLLSPGLNFYEPLKRVPPGLYVGEELGKNYLNISLGTDTKFVLGHGSNETVVISAPEDKPAINLIGSDGKKTWSTK